jgi:hypothetical protein
VNEFHRGTKPPSSAKTTTVVVRGLDHTCWKCGELITCVVAIHTQEARQSDDWLWLEDKHALSLARDLLGGAGQGRLPATIKERFSKTAGGNYLSNGCPRCDAIQGDWPLGQAIADYASGAPLEELPVLATGAVAAAVWQEAADNQNMTRGGYPMTWADLD